MTERQKNPTSKESAIRSDIKLKNFLFKLVVQNGKVICIVKMGDLESVFHRNTFVFQTVGTLYMKSREEL